MFENAFATAAALVAIILAVGPVSGAHLNPVITLTDWLLGGVRHVEATVYIAAQVLGLVVGAIVANLMFSYRRSSYLRNNGTVPGCGSGRSSRPSAWFLLSSLS